MKSFFLVKKLLYSLLLFFVFTPSKAAIDELNKVNIDNLTISGTIIGTPFPSSINDFSPPLTINMGEHKGVLLSGVINTSLGDIEFDVQSTGIFGDLAPQGMVDSALGTIDFILNDLYMTASGVATGTVDLWDESTSIIDTNIYDGLTNSFIYGWSDARSFAINGFGNQSVNYSIEISGVASVVPIAPAIWLFGTALVSMFSVSSLRRKL